MSFFSGKVFSGGGSPTMGRRPTGHVDPRRPTSQPFGVKPGAPVTVNGVTTHRFDDSGMARPPAPQAPAMSAAVMPQGWQEPQQPIAQPAPGVSYALGNQAPQQAAAQAMPNPMSQIFGATDMASYQNMVDSQRGAVQQMYNQPTGQVYSQNVEDYRSDTGHLPTNFKASSNPMMSPNYTYGPGTFSGNGNSPERDPSQLARANAFRNNPNRQGPGWPTSGWRRPVTTGNKYDGRQY